jgi:lycopene cyclase domain-containing protein
MRYTYLLIDLLAVSVPFLFSFHPRIRFIDKWKAFIPAVLITALLFLIWDSWFTKMGVWSFNYDYLTGINIFNIPIEEVLFFICIPYACLFTYYSISLWKVNRPESKFNSHTLLFPVLILLSAGIYFYGNWYTTFVFISLAFFLIILMYLYKVLWIRNYFLSCLFLIIPFLICNGILTGTGIDDAIVKYNDDENLGIRILTIPIEDLFYGMLMIGLNVFLFERLKNKEVVEHQSLV